jgi:putative drug exporter of the RND superfamily
VTADEPAATGGGARLASTSEPAPGNSWGRRLRWLLPAVLLLVWLALGGVGGPYSGRLSEVQRNDTSSFLPANAESTKVLDEQAKFSSSQSFPAFVLMTGNARLAPSQLAEFRQFAQQIPDVEVPVTGAAPRRVGDFLVPGPIAVVPSQDGKAVVAFVNFNANQAFSTLADGTNPIQKSVEALRSADQRLATNGASVYVAGPAGTIADFVKAFAGIDGTLLLVALVAVLVILLIVYRSPVVPIFVLATSLFALSLASLAVYYLAKNDVIKLNGQSQGILSILVIGAATDYSLLLVSRYREELRRHDDRYDAMWLAWRRTLEPVAASAGTVILSLLCLLLSELQSTKGLGPVGAIGIAAALLAAMTFLPALLVLPGRNQPGEHGRWVFWPAVPHVGSQGPETRGIWAGVARLVGGHPMWVAIASGVGLLVLAAFLPTLKANGVKQSDTFLTTVESVQGDEALAQHFPAGSGSPTIVIGPAGNAAAIQSTIKGTPGVAAVAPVTNAPQGAGSGQPGAGSGQPGAGQPGVPQLKVVDGLVQFQVTLKDPADSTAAEETVRRLRADLDAVSRDALVGGATAQSLDIRDISQSDRNRVIPIILVVIFVVLALLLRALVAPLVLLVGNVLSFAATLGASAIAFNHIFDFPGSDPSVTLLAFVFLVALGIDYSIFLMTRVREESIRSGTRPGILRGLAVTGGVITSAGVVLASTFAALGVLPILFLAQIAFIVAFGVLLDTIVVRSLFVPSVSYVIGAPIWWPSRLSRTSREAPAGGPGEPEPEPVPSGAPRL